MISLRASFFGLFSGLVLAACSLAPPYEKPALPVPTSFFEPTHEPEVGVDPQVAMPTWQTFFQDPLLNARISEAFVYNRNYQLAMISARESQAQYGVQNADRLPSLEVQGQEEATGGPRKETMRRYEAGVQIPFFELDFFGRVKNQSTSALEKYLASEAAAQTAKLLLMRDVAKAHYALRFAEAKRDLAQMRFQNEKTSYDLLLAKLKIGQAGAQDISTQEAQIKEAEASLLSRTRDITRAQNALFLLLGRFEPKATDKMPLSLEAAAFLPLQNLDTRVLLGRPDVIEAEHNLRASYADIGAARAAFFPKVSLFGSFGYVSEEFSSLIDAPNALLRFLPQITLPIFSAGRNSGNLELAEIRKEATVVRYEQVIEQAFREVLDALHTQADFAKEKEARRLSQNALQRAYELTYRRFLLGNANYQALLDAKNAQDAARLSYLEIQEGEMGNAIDLYIALGGGEKSTLTPEAN